MNIIPCFKSRDKIFSENSKLNKIYVLNNNSCDMDSFICSVLLSTCRNIKENILYIENDKSEIPTNNQFIFNKYSDKIYLPLMNCKKGELRTRLDIDFVLKYFKFDENEFYYIDDEQVIYDLHNSLANLILVDHNILDPTQISFTNLVTEIYDHHNDVNSLNYSYRNLKKKSLKFPLGSCSTLVLLEYYLSDKNVRRSLKHYYDPLFLIAAILLDTDNFKKELHATRWIDLDFYVCKKIVNDLIDVEGQDKWEQVKEFYKKLSNAKFDETANLYLGVDSLMNKDMKSFKWGNLTSYWSSLQIGLKSITKMYGWNCVISHFEKNLSSKENISLPLYVTLSAYSGKLNGMKILVIYDYLQKVEFSNFQNFLFKELGANLKNIKYKKNSNNKLLKVYVDKIYSRKLLEPILCKYFEILN